MTGEAGSNQFTFPELSEELARADRPWVRQWSTLGVVGFLAGGVGLALVGIDWKAETTSVYDWVGAVLLSLCLLPAGLATWLVGAHPRAPVEALVSRDGVEFRGPGARAVRLLWRNHRRRLVLCDLRATVPVWAESGVRRRIETILVGVPKVKRVPLPRQAVDALVDSAVSHGWVVRETKEKRTRHGVVPCAELLPPPAGRAAAPRAPGPAPGR